jgi:prepilin-type processing-associated H-X9-DG protein
MRAPLDTGAGPFTVHAGTQALRHAGKSTNVVYADGHGQTLHTVYNKPDTDEKLLTLQGAPDHGFLSEDNAAYDLTRD